MKSLEELEALRKKLQGQMQVRDSTGKIEISVSMGTCGIASGARQIMKVLLQELSNNNIQDVSITQTSCKGVCSYEPLIQVHCPGQEKVTYVNLDEEKVKKIVSEHLVNGRIIREWTTMQE